MWVNIEYFLYWGKEKWSMGKLFQIRCWEEEVFSKQSFCFFWESFCIAEMENLSVFFHTQRVSLLTPCRHCSTTSLCARLCAHGMLSWFWATYQHWGNGAPSFREFERLWRIRCKMFSRQNSPLAVRKLGIKKAGCKSSWH